MSKEHEAKQSFVSMDIEALRKNVIQYLENHYSRINKQHLAYIGFEICRAKFDVHYKQD